MIFRNRSVRNPSIELLRCLAMFVIVMLHINKYCVLPSGAEWSHAFRAMAYWGVDCFLAISGWYGVRFSWKKIVSLVSLMYFYLFLDLVCSYAVGIRIQPGRSLAAIGDWFGTTYIVLMLMSGYLNAAIDALYKKSSNTLLAAWLLLCIGCLLSWAPYHLFAPVHASGWSSCSLLTMIFVYLTARTCRFAFVRKVKLRWLLLCLCILPAWVFGVAVATWMWNVEGVACDAYISNIAPHVYVFAVALTLMFVWYVRVPDCIGRIVSYVAPSMFAVYLIHETTVLGRYTYLLPLQYLQDHWQTLFGLEVLISACVSFLLCLGIDICRRLLTGRIREAAGCCLVKVDEQWIRFTERNKEG